MSAIQEESMPFTQRLVRALVSSRGLLVIGLGLFMISSLVFTEWAAEVYPFLDALQDDLVFTPTFYVFLALFFSSLAAIAASFIRTLILVARLAVRRSHAMA
jgi:hypothetical protein